MKKSLLLLLFAICSLASWADGFNAVVPSGQTLSFSITDEQNKTVRIEQQDRNLSGDLVIPDSISNGTTKYAVTELGYLAFWCCSGLTSVTIGPLVSYIGPQAFYRCLGLTSITIGPNVTQIYSNAFMDCTNLDTLYYNAKNTIPIQQWYGPDPPGITGLHLHYLEIGDSVQSLPFKIFSGQSDLPSITVPSSVNSIGNNAFEGVNTVIYCGNAGGRPWGAQKVYCVSRDSLYYQDCDTTIVCGYVEGLTNANIPNGVTTIATNAFKYCSTLTSLAIPPSLTTIEDDAFVRCTNMDALFYNAKNLSTGQSGFRQMKLRHLTIGDSVQSLPNYVFYGQDSLVNVTIPNSVTSIGNCAFEGCSSLTKINIPYSVTSIGRC